MPSMPSVGQSAPQTLLERALDTEALDAIITAGCGVGLVEGPAGIGKTSLLSEAIGQARSGGAIVLTARGSELESALGFGVVRQLLERHVGTLGSTKRNQLLAGVASLAAGVVDPSTELGDDGNDRSLAVVHALSWVMFRIAETSPLVVAVDDAHWADEASQRFLSYLAPRLDGHDIVLLATVRIPDVAATAGPLLKVLRGRADAVVHPAALSPLAVATVVRDRLGPAWPRAAGAFHRATGGNPLYLRHLLRRLAEVGPDPELVSEADIERLGGLELEDDIDARLGLAGPDARTMALALAALGDDRPLAQLARTAGLDAPTAAAARKRLAAFDILTADPDAIAFVHPVVRAAVLRLVPPGAHRAVAAGLAAEGADVEDVAAHVAREAPGGDGWTVDVLRDAARRSIARGAVDVGLGLLDRALAEPPAADVLPDVLAEAGEAAAWVARSDFAALLTSAWQSTSDPSLRARRALVLAKALGTLSRNVEAADVLTAAEAELGDAHPHLAAVLRTQLVIVGLQDARLVMRALPAIASLADLPDDPAARELLGLMEGMTIGMGGGSQAECLERMSPAPDVTAVGWDVRAFTAMGTLGCGAYDEAHRMFAEAADHGRRLGSARARLTAVSGWQISAWMRGDLETAIAEGRPSVDLCYQMGAPDSVIVTTAVLALSLFDAGETAEASALIAGAPDPEQHPHLWACLLYTAEARRHLLEGDPAGAVATIRRGDERFASLLPATVPSAGLFLWRSPLIEALIAAGDGRAARSEAASELAQARTWGNTRALGIALRDAARAMPEQRDTLLAESVAVLRDDAKHPLELARSLAAVWHHRSDEASRTEALQLARACGASPLVAALQGVPQQGGPGTRLTRAERPVVELVADGLTNAEVAARLHLSQATVKTHLLRAFEKLQVRNRTELARAWRQPLD